MSSFIIPPSIPMPMIIPSAPLADSDGGSDPPPAIISNLQAPSTSKPKQSVIKSRPTKPPISNKEVLAIRQQIVDLFESSEQTVPDLFDNHSQSTHSSSESDDDDLPQPAIPSMQAPMFAACKNMINKTKEYIAIEVESSSAGSEIELGGEYAQLLSTTPIPHPHISHSPSPMSQLPAIPSMVPMMNLNPVPSHSTGSTLSAHSPAAAYIPHAPSTIYDCSTADPPISSNLLKYYTGQPLKLKDFQMQPPDNFDIYDEMYFIHTDPHKRIHGDHAMYTISVEEAAKYIISQNAKSGIFTMHKHVGRPVIEYYDSKLLDVYEDFEFEQDGSMETISYHNLIEIYQNKPAAVSNHYQYLNTSRQNGESIQRRIDRWLFDSLSVEGWDIYVNRDFKIVRSLEDYHQLILCLLMYLAIDLIDQSSDNYKQLISHFDNELPYHCFYVGTRKYVYQWNNGPVYQHWINQQWFQQNNYLIDQDWYQQSHQRFCHQYTFNHAWAYWYVLRETPNLVQYRMIITPSKYTAKSHFYSANNVMHQQIKEKLRQDAQNALYSYLNQLMANKPITTDNVNLMARYAQGFNKDHLHSILNHQDLRVVVNQIQTTVAHDNFDKMVNLLPTVQENNLYNKYQSKELDVPQAVDSIVMSRFLHAIDFDSIQSTMQEYVNLTGKCVASWTTMFIANCIAILCYMTDIKTHPRDYQVELITNFKRIASIIRFIMYNFITIVLSLTFSIALQYGINYFLQEVLNYELPFFHIYFYLFLSFIVSTPLFYACLFAYTSVPTYAFDESLQTMSISLNFLLFIILFYFILNYFKRTKVVQNFHKYGIIQNINIMRGYYGRIYFGFMKPPPFGPDLPPPPSYLAYNPQHRIVAWSHGPYFPWYNPAIVDTKDVGNLKDMLDNRVYHERPPHDKQYLLKFKKWVHDNLPNIFPIQQLLIMPDYRVNWMEKYSGKKKRAILKAYDKFLSSPPTSSKDFKRYHAVIQMFAKEEVLPKDDIRSVRAIQSRDDIYNVAWSAPIQKVSDTLKKLWNANNKIPCGFGEERCQFNFAAGHNRLSAGQVHETYSQAAQQNFQDPVVVCTDFSKYDMTVNEILLDIEMMCYKFIIFIDFIAQSIFDHHVYDSKGHCNEYFFQLLKQFMLHTGDIITCVGNTIRTMLMLSFQMVEIQNKHHQDLERKWPANLVNPIEEYHMMMDYIPMPRINNLRISAFLNALGDDGERYTSMQIAKLIEKDDTLSRLGMVVKTKITSLDQAEFCSSKYFPTSIGPILIPKLTRTLCKTFIDIHPIGHNKIMGYARAIAQGMMFDYYNYPIMRIILRHILRTTRGYKRWLPPNYKQGFRHTPCSWSLTEDSIEWFVTEYGVAWEDVLKFEAELEAELASINSPIFGLDHPILRQMFKIDNGFLPEEVSVQYSEHDHYLDVPFQKEMYDTHPIVTMNDQHRVFHENDYQSLLKIRERKSREKAVDEIFVDENYKLPGWYY
jgi:hypothetical protein